MNTVPWNREVAIIRVRWELVEFKIPLSPKQRPQTGSDPFPIIQASASDLTAHISFHGREADS